MDLSTSSSRSSSQDNIFPQVQSPLPIRNPIINKNKLLPSFAFLDFVDEPTETSNELNKLSLQNLRSFHSEGWMPKEQDMFEDEQNEAERGSGVWRRCSLRAATVSIRPPSRACNPLVHDEEFIRMNKSSIGKANKDNGPITVHRVGINPIELIERA